MTLIGCTRCMVSCNWFVCQWPLMIIYTYCIDDNLPIKILVAWYWQTYAHHTHISPCTHRQRFCSRCAAAVKRSHLPRRGNKSKWFNKGYRISFQVHICELPTLLYFRTIWDILDIGQNLAVHSPAFVSHQHTCALQWRSQGWAW